MSRIVTLREARERGLTRYFTGRSCAQGHVASRRVASRSCSECDRVKSKRFYDNNRETYLERQRQWQSENRHTTRAASKRWKERNPERNKEGRDRWIEQNQEHLVKRHRERYVKNRDRYLAHNKKWNAENPEARLALNAKRRADNLCATPQWLTKEHLAQIRAFYVEARKLTKETGVPHNVDHIFPLRGRNCAGLHVPWNLQILTASENFRKRNHVPKHLPGYAFGERFGA